MVKREMMKQIYSIFFIFLIFSVMIIGCTQQPKKTIQPQQEEVINDITGSISEVDNVQTELGDDQEIDSELDGLEDDILNW